MNDLPLVSIITPSYNQADYLEKTIESILAQDYLRIEYIIVDGASKDGSLAIIEKYTDRLAWWVSEKDRGHADALNKGFAHATGDILAWLNSDDLYSTPHVVSEAVEYLRANPGVGMVYADANLIDHNGAVIGQFPARQTSYKDMLRGSVHIPQATTFFRAERYREVGPLSLELFFSFDYDLWVRLAKVSEVRYVPRLWADFRLHEAGKSVVNDDRCYPDMIRVSERETGRRAVRLRLRHWVRKNFYARLPWRARVWLRKALTR